MCLFILCFSDLIFFFFFDLMTETMPSFVHVVVIDKFIIGMFRPDASSVSSVVTTARYMSESKIFSLCLNFIILLIVLWGNDLVRSMRLSSVIHQL